MSKETGIITRALYQAILEAKSQDEAAEKARGIMDAEDVALVEQALKKRGVI